MKSLQREIVEATIGMWPKHAPTNGYMRHALEVIGIPTRGVPMTDTQLLRLCQENGLDFNDGTVENEENGR